MPSSELHDRLARRYNPKIAEWPRRSLTEITDRRSPLRAENPVWLRLMARHKIRRASSVQSLKTDRRRFADGAKTPLLF
jgi:hypothetical protein